VSVRNSLSNSFFFSIVTVSKICLSSKSYLLPYKSSQCLVNCQTHSRNIYSSRNNGLLNIPSPFSGDVFHEGGHVTLCQFYFSLQTLRIYILKFFSSVISRLVINFISMTILSQCLNLQIQALTCQYRTFQRLKLLCDKYLPILPSESHHFGTSKCTLK
jgi:hypothetical protein